MLKKEKVKQGKKNRRSGAEFEKKVRADLESKGWIVDKWTNNVEFGVVMDIGKLVPSKPKFNPFTHSLMMNKSGFPDFICFRNMKDMSVGLGLATEIGNFSFGTALIAVEAKSNGYLDKEEKRKCIWLLENKIFSKILIAKKKEGGIEYKEFV